MEYRIEHDTMGEVRVPADHFWGAQTQRSLENFAIGTETRPAEVIRAFAVLKSACAASNMELGRLDRETGQAITQACAGILEGRYPHEFPLKVWQTGSGTQSNMNVNEVIAHIAAQDHPGLKIHPNDHVNMSQSSNDTFPTAMNVAAVLAIRDYIYPSLDRLTDTLRRLEQENEDVIKIGRTHLQDAVPLRFSQEISGWRAMLEENRRMLEQAADHLRDLAIGGTAVGTGLNCPAGFDRLCAEKISALTGDRFRASSNKFHALTSKDAYVFTSGALKALAANLMKIANDVRWLASGPRCGIEISAYVEALTRGRVQLGPGTLYTILNKFQEVGFLREVSVEGRKRTYALTEEGNRAYIQELERLRQCLRDAASAPSLALGEGGDPREGPDLAPAPLPAL